MWRHSQDYNYIKAMNQLCVKCFYVQELGGPLRFLGPPLSIERKARPLLGKREIKAALWLVECGHH